MVHRYYEILILDMFLIQLHKTQHLYSECCKVENTSIFYMGEQS